MNHRQRTHDDGPRLRVPADLGLAVVAAIASAYGASLRARARPEGGLDITVGFPAAGEPW